MSATPLMLARRLLRAICSKCYPNVQRLARSIQGWVLAKVTKGESQQASHVHIISDAVGCKERHKV